MKGEITMTKNKIVALSMFLALLLISVYARGKDTFSLDEILPESVVSVEVEIDRQGSGIPDYKSLDSTEIEEFKEWAQQLSLNPREYKDGETPAEIYCGGHSYKYRINDGEVEFSYLEIDKNYIWYDNHWYEITNPNAPPIGA